MFVLNYRLDVAAFSVLISLFFCLLCCVVDNLLGFWVFLELGSLSAIPALLYNFNLNNKFYCCILCYIIVSGLSSVVLVSGLLINNLYYFVFFGFVIKFGMFPFMFWVYQVFSLGNWIFIFILSVILKFPILFLNTLYNICDVNLIYLDCFFTIFVCSFLFWFFSLSWEFIWCHISLSSVATLMAACFCSSLELCFFIYWYYFFWASLCVFYFIKVVDVNDIKGWSFWLFCILLLVTPISIPLFYKLSMIIGILYSSIYLLVVWSIYSFSEQFFLYKLASDYFFVNVYNNWV
uniref:NADH dehydrogenase subunit 2 n=1 Tax=Taenia laticollis TaxID=1035110 RepID=N0DLE6_9CEST|nr:NADH dehydrogenase subunit 2 [Taenia laticollis]BAN15635.1 NADH dehydrogenase subunit 2 [Taenia laticollis]